MHLSVKNYWDAPPEEGLLEWLEPLWRHVRTMLMDKNEIVLEKYLGRHPSGITSLAWGFSPDFLCTGSTLVKIKITKH